MILAHAEGCQNGVARVPMLSLYFRGGLQGYSVVSVVGEIREMFCRVISRFRVEAKFEVVVSRVISLFRSQAKFEASSFRGDDRCFGLRRNSDE